MRYRPFGRSGGAASSLCLALTDAPMRATDRLGLIRAALDVGVNTFELHGRDPDVAAALGRAISSVDRETVFVAQRIAWSTERRGGEARDVGTDAVFGALEAALTNSDLRYVDVAILDIADGERLPAHILPCLRAAQAHGLVRMLGVAGGDVVESHIRTGEFEVLVAGFNILSGWLDRSRLTRAAQAGMSIIGCDYHPVGLGGGALERPKGPLGLGRLLPRKARPPGAYGFLDQARGWTAEEICLGYALTEPALAAIQTTVREPKHLRALAAVVERDLPAGLPAQIEIARFSADDDKRTLAKRRA